MRLMPSRSFTGAKNFVKERSVRSAGNLLPLCVSDIPFEKIRTDALYIGAMHTGAMEMEIHEGAIRVTGNVDAEALRTVLEYLAE